MKIAVLNECFLEEKHISILKKIGEVLVYKDTDTEIKALERFKDIDVAIIDGFICPITDKILDSASRLKFISIHTTGFDFLNKEEFQKRNIRVSNVPNYASKSVAELAIGLMFAVLRRIPQGDHMVRAYSFEVDRVKNNHKTLLGSNMYGKTLGVIGLGRIGDQVAYLGNALGMKVIAYNRSPRQANNVEMVSLENLLQRSDIVSIHMALTPETEHIVSEKELTLMKPNAIIINTARGKLIKTDALYQALKDKKIAGAGLDTLAELHSSNPLLTLENIVFTPHVAFFTQESLENMADIIVDNIMSFAKGNPKNLVM